MEAIGSGFLSEKAVNPDEGDFPPEWDDVDSLDPAAPLEDSEPVHEAATLVLRHLGGALAEVVVTEATDNGCLHVRWRGNAGMYVVHVFRVVESRGYALLYATPGSRRPLPWQAKDPEGARGLWRRMTGREKQAEWVGVWKNGRREWLLK